MADLTELPWVPGMVIDRLSADTKFMVDCGNRLFSRSPDNVSDPYVTVQSTRPLSVDGGGVAFSPLVQLDAYCAPATGIEDPTVWTLPWKVIQEFSKQSEQENRIFYEPRCVEGNYGHPAVLKASRPRRFVGEGSTTDPRQVSMTRAATLYRCTARWFAQSYGSRSSSP